MIEGHEHVYFPRQQRALSLEEMEILHAKQKDRPIVAYCTTHTHIPYGSKPGGRGPWNGDYEKIIPPGTTMRITLISRMGDIGLNDDLTAEYGYGIRFEIDDTAIKNIRRTP